MEFYDRNIEGPVVQGKPLKKDPDTQTDICYKAANSDKC